MQKRKFTAKEKTALIVLVILMVAVIGIGAFIIVNNVNTTNREATNTSHTTVKITTPPDEETVAENGATEQSAETVKNDKKDSKKSSSVSSSKASSKKSSAKTSKSSKTKSTKTPKKKPKPKKAVDSNEDVISIVTPKNNTSHKSDDKCKINGVTCYVGDTISITLNLKCSKTLVNYQGYTNFDTDYLKCKSTKANVGIVNNKDDKIYYNASDINGMDFSNEGTIYTAQFTVKKSGSTSIKNTLQILTDMNDKEVSTGSAKDSLNIFS